MFVMIGTEALCIFAMILAGVAAVTGFDLAATQIFAFGVTSFKVSVVLGGLLFLAGLSSGAAAGIAQSEL